MINARQDRAEFLISELMKGFFWHGKSGRKRNLFEKNMSQNGVIFKATYSGVPVYEMLCKGVAVMRRRSDSYLNATQILKVADFDKPQRTRILEREVQTGTHEKVQGGYGKYQGTRMSNPEYFCWFELMFV